MQGSGSDGAVSSAAAGSPAAMTVGLQLYTLRHRMEADVDDALACAARAGYEAVELFGGWWSVPPDGWRRLLRRFDLRAAAAHTTLDALRESGASQVAEEMGVVGCDRLIVPWVPPELRATAQDYVDLGATLNDLGTSLKARSLHLGYHNHEWEFELEGETDGLTLVTAQMSHPGMFVELDVFWAAWAGLDPVALVRNFGSRLRMLHVKDGRLAPEKTPDEAEILPAGSGDLPMLEILRAARDARVEAVFVELDRFPGGPPDDEAAITESLRFLRATLDQLGVEVRS